MTNPIKHLYLLLPFLLIMVSCDEQYKLMNTHLNEIQIIGSHNSYKKAIEPELWQLIFEEDSLLALSLQYEHLTITQQLDLGLHSLEIDIFHDPQGGRYTSPLGLATLTENDKETLPFDTKGDLVKPGLKVFHVQDIDFRSHNLLFTDCLLELMKWSDKNKNHVPVIITINAKDQSIEMEDSALPLPFSKAALDSIDLEIRSVFNESQLITPSLIQKSYPTLEQAILENGWPKIKDIKGRFLFVLDESGKKIEDYLQTKNKVKKQVMFVDVEEGNPNAAFRIINDPVENQNYIKTLTEKGYLVRTRADADTEEARDNSTERFRAAVSSGAQVISTDYYFPSRLFRSEYQVSFANKSYVKLNHR